MQKKKPNRNWQAYGLYRKDEEVLFLEKVKKTIWNVDAPWEPKTGGRPAFPTKAKVMCALKVKFGFDYRSESHLRSRPDLLEIMELHRAPSKSVIHDGLKRTPASIPKRQMQRLPNQSKKRHSAGQLRIWYKDARPGLTSRQTGTDPENPT